MKNFVFITVYKSLPRADRQKIKIRDRIISECKITKSIFYNWLSGITPIDELSRPIIAKIFNIPEDELFPTKQTNQIINQ